MSFTRGILASLCLLLCNSMASAADLQLKNLTSDDMRGIVGDTSANFLHTTVSGASTLGHVFGFEVGVVGGTTNTPHLDDVVKQTDSSASANKLANVSLFGVLSVPFGITAELGFLPPVGSSSFKANTMSLAAKWTLTESVIDLPFSLAVRGSYTGTHLKFNQDVSGTTINYKYDDRQTSLVGLISKNFVIVEPYFGLGVVSARGELTADDSAVFTGGGTSMSASRSSTDWMVGAELKLLIVKLGVEYSNAFSTGRVDGKVSFYF